MLDVAEAIALPALLRQESRGAHQREDFPLTDDKRLTHLTISLRHRKITAERLPWPDALRKVI
jgi:succinate dehydrogenase/fumarate reductase flavoprotein subunit